MCMQWKKAYEKIVWRGILLNMQKMLWWRHPISNLTGILPSRIGRLMSSIRNKLRKGRWPLTNRRRKKGRILRKVRVMLWCSRNRRKLKSSSRLLSLPEEAQCHSNRRKMISLKAFHLVRGFWGSRSNSKSQKLIRNHPKRKRKKPKIRVEFGKEPKYLKDSWRILTDLKSQDTPRLKTSQHQTSTWLSRT